MVIGFIALANRRNEDASTISTPASIAREKLENTSP